MQSQTEQQRGGSNINGTLSALGVPSVLDGRTGRHDEVRSRPENNHRSEAEDSSGVSASQSNILFPLFYSLVAVHILLEVTFTFSLRCVASTVVGKSFLDAFCICEVLYCAKSRS